MAINLSKNDVKSKDVHPNVQVLIKNEQLYPPAEQIDLNSGKGMWTIKGYRIWAENYEQALDIFPMIESF